MENIFEQAHQSKYAIPQFNINNLEWTRYILEACQAEKSPVILGVSESTVKYMGSCLLIRNVVDNLIKCLNITIPVILHLDHGHSFEICQSAYDAGFDSIMFDGSHLSLTENIELTNKIRNYCQKAYFEAEIGRINLGNEQVDYTNFADAIQFYEKTNIDLLAPSIGTLHGIYKEEPKINYQLISSLNANNIKLVIHGASGLDELTLKKIVSLGVVKVNINTELQLSWNRAVRDYLQTNPDIYDPRKIISSGSNAMKETIKNYISILGSKNKGK